MHLFLDALCRTARAAIDCEGAFICLDDGSVFGSTSRIPCELWPPRGTVFVDQDTAVVPLLSSSEAIVGILGVRGGRGDLHGALEDLAVLASQFLQQRALAQDAAMFRVLAENSADTIIRGSIDGVRRYVSPSIRNLLGYEAHELVGKRAVEIVHPDDIPEFGALMRSMGEGEIDSFTTEHRMLHKDGAWVWLEAFVKVTHDQDTGERDGYVVSVRDTSRRKELEDRLVHNAFHDSLTGLGNRALLDERIQQEIARVSKHGYGLAVLCLDLDGFKQVNDAHGHAAGDAILIAVAERLQSCVGVSDTLARRGGDEFVIVHVTDAVLPESAVALADRLLDALAAPLPLGSTTVAIGLSIGIAVAPGSGVEAEALLRAADDAMYGAKMSGRNCYRLGDEPR